MTPRLDAIKARLAAHELCGCNNQWAHVAANAPADLAWLIEQLETEGVNVQALMGELVLTREENKKLRAELDVACKALGRVASGGVDPDAELSTLVKLGTWSIPVGWNPMSFARDTLERMGRK